MSGPLKISECAGCGATAWPIRQYCSSCFEQMQVVDAPEEGRILEYSQKDGCYFCVTEFGSVRLLCRLNSPQPPKVGQKAKLLVHEAADQCQSFVIGPV